MLRLHEYNSAKTKEFCDFDNDRKDTLKGANFISLRRPVAGLEKLRGHKDFQQLVFWNSLGILGSEDALDEYKPVLRREGWGMEA